MLGPDTHADLLIDAITQAADLLRQAAGGGRLRDGAAVDHRGGKIGAQRLSCYGDWINQLVTSSLFNGRCIDHSGQTTMWTLQLLFRPLDVVRR